MELENASTGGENPAPLFFANHKYEYRHLRNKYGPFSKRERLLRFLHSNPVQIVLALLLLLDVLALIIDLILSSEFPDCSKVISNAFCYNASSMSEDEVLGISEGVGIACKEHSERLEHTEAALIYLSLSILVIFEIELIITMLVVGKIFFRQTMYLIDFSVVTISLFLEILLRNSADEAAAGLIVFVRIWRLVRIGHGK